MKKFRVIIPPAVQEQIRAQVRYIARDSIDSALAWEGRLRAKILAIGALPKGCKVDEVASTRLGQEVRKLIFEQTYLLHYRVDTKRRAIDVLNFRHGARLPRPGEP